jgi:pyrroline-5-carboxylate reductase
LYEVALIGAGNMGEAMLKGWLESGLLKDSDILVSEKVEARAREIKERYRTENADAISIATREAKTIVLAVKPQDSGGVLEEISGGVDSDKTILSIVAGLPLTTIRGILGSGPTLVRAMPNLAARVRAAVTAYAIDAGTGSTDRETVEDLLRVIGDVVEVQEGYMDLVTALSGSGPAYFFLLVEALEEAGVRRGLTREIAGRLARETLWGAAKTIKETGTEAGELRAAVSSPGGTTVAALEQLEKSGFAEAIDEAVGAAQKRAAELTQQ